MKFGEKALVILISVVLAVALAALFGRLFPPQRSLDEVGPLDQNDDAPIIMTGGSIFIGTDGKAKFDRADENNRKFLKYNENFRVSQIELTDKKDVVYTIPKATIALNPTGRIEIDYCVITPDQNNEDNDTCTQNKTDKLTLKFNNNTPMIGLRNEHAKQVGKAWQVLPTLWRFKVPDLVLFKVRAYLGNNVDPTAEAKCGRRGDCEVQVHTCTNQDVTQCRIRQ